MLNACNPEYREEEKKWTQPKRWKEILVSRNENASSGQKRPSDLICGTLTGQEPLLEIMEKNNRIEQAEEELCVC